MAVTKHLTSFETQKHRLAQITLKRVIEYSHDPMMVQRIRVSSPTCNSLGIIRNISFTVGDSIVLTVEYEGGIKFCHIITHRSRNDFSFYIIRDNTPTAIPHPKVRKLYIG